MMYIVNKITMKYHYGWYLDENFAYRPFRIKRDAEDMIKYDMSLYKKKDNYNATVREDGCYEVTFGVDTKVLYKITKIDVGE